ncbi:hypothetical protein ASPZODRAFT_130978 [Penicilliopsis zonata CBS 506.65]|uniref:RGS domain-containing protein n=1 Tax=Penicilliopsis zonata CBS 506.65 TaxID=1073090 RepID=A0A1L9SKA3_9EURO|nr:hypothetical protein ASPZODRAFT_130978 [Penicilliopsis zonata CBS 506.65]OJJ47484.1 hypothetical protein ASPZODRAFT_130978 [Penicilliopsis zonata CBS 506.65]
MLTKKSLHPPLFSRNPTPSSTPPELSPTSSSSDTDSDEDMDSTASGSRPTSLAVPPGAFCAMRPTLDEVLANTAPPPYTLSAFMAYLSQNHCLETLEFTLEANRYRDTYVSFSHQLTNHPPPPFAPDGPESQHLRMLWQRLLAAYVLPGAPREVNLTSEVRDELLRHTDASCAPPPETLDSAVKRVHELMEESIFLPFLNSHSAAAQVVPLSEPLFGSDEGIMPLSSAHHHYHPHNNNNNNNNHYQDEGATPRVRSRRRLSPQASTRDLGSFLSGSSGSHSGRSNFSLSAVTSIGKSSSGSRTPGGGPGESASPILTDDTGSLGSGASVGEPMTPPTTPPSNEPFMSLAHSPKTRTENPWKKMGMKLGFKKRSNGGNSTSRDSRFEE